MKVTTNIVPINKNDLLACQRLSMASDEEVIQVLSDLFEWLQDGNWPVALPIIDRIRLLRNPLVEPIKVILRGNDESWKYNIISQLLPVVGNSVLNEIAQDLENIISSPTESELTEEVVQVAKELLDASK